MKKIVSLIALFFIFNSCDTGNDAPNYLFEILPIESVDIPAEFTLGNTYHITMHYKLPTTCHYFNTIYYNKNLNVRTVAIESAVAQRNDCTDYTAEQGNAEASFDFLVTSNGSYIFKFYQGQDANGNDLFLQYEVPVN